MQSDSSDTYGRSESVTVASLPPLLSLLACALGCGQYWIVCFRGPKGAIIRDIHNQYIFWVKGTNDGSWLYGVAPKKKLAAIARESPASCSVNKVSCKQNRPGLICSTVATSSSSQAKRKKQEARILGYSEATNKKCVILVW